MRDEELLEKILKPIPGLNPAGEYLRYTSIYDRIQEARLQEDDHLPQGVWKQPIKKVNWSLITGLCIEGLTEKSKDLQICAWLFHAQVMQQGMIGLNEGLAIIHALSTHFWAYAYPILELDDPTARLAPYEWLDKHLPEALLHVMVTETRSRDSVNFSYVDWMTITQNQKTSQSNFGIYQRPELDPETFQNSVRTTPVEFYNTLSNQITQGIDQVSQLEDFISKKLSLQSTLFSNLRQRLKHLEFFSRQLSETAYVTPSIMTPESPPILPEIPDISEPTASSLPDGPQDHNNLSDPHGGTYTSRQQAYAQLGNIANFLSQEEGESPTVYALRQIMLWEHKMFSEIFSSVSSHADRLHAVMHFLGMI